MSLKWHAFRWNHVCPSTGQELYCCSQLLLHKLEVFSRQWRRALNRPVELGMGNRSTDHDGDRMLRGILRRGGQDGMYIVYIL
jgi:hypothetical protein